MEWGQIAAAGAALCWACSSIIYGRARLDAWTINFAKNLLGTLIVLLHLLVLWILFEQTFLQFSLNSWFYLVVSGIVGIAIGDTCYFRSLQIMGPRRSLVVATTSPIFGVILGWLILNESIGFYPIMGIVVTILGISVVVLDKKARSESPGHFPGSEFIGVVFGLLAAFCQATGGAISKIAMEECSPLEATFVRLLAAMLFGLIWFAIRRKLCSTLNTLAKPKNLKMLVPAAALGTWLGIWCSQIGFKYSSIAMATMFMSTSPLFALPLVWYFDGHRITARAIWGTVLALLGIAGILFANQLQ